MKILDYGHIYELAHLDGAGVQRLVFVNREAGKQHEGTLNQEVLRALIDRVMYLNRQLPWHGNGEIIQHLRMALVLHEARVLERKTERKLLAPESVPVGPDGHFEIPKA